MNTLSDIAINVKSIMLNSTYKHSDRFDFMIVVEKNDYIMTNFHIVVTSMEGNYILDRFNVLFKLTNEQKENILIIIKNNNLDFKKHISINDVCIEQRYKLKKYKLPTSEFNTNKTFLTIDIPEYLFETNISFKSDSFETKIQEFFYYYDINSFSSYNIKEKKLHIHKTQNITNVEYLNNKTKNKIYSFYELTNKIQNSSYSYGFNKENIIEQMYRIDKLRSLKNNVFFEVTSENDLTILGIYSPALNLASCFYYDLDTILNNNLFEKDYYGYINDMIIYSYNKNKIKNF